MPADIQGAHQASKASAIEDAEEHLNDESTVGKGEGIAVFTLGLGRFKHVLGPAIEKAKR